MFEICALLAPKKKARATRKPAGKRIARGARVAVNGVSGFTVTRRDSRYANAWFIEKDGRETPFSVAGAAIKIET